MNTNDFARAVLDASARTHLLATCLARLGGPHVVTTLGVFKTLSDDERCELCADTLRRLEAMNNVPRA